MTERSGSTAADQIALLIAEADRYSRTSLVPAFKTTVRLAAGRKERTLREAVESLQRYEQLRDSARRILARETGCACSHGVSVAAPCQHCIDALLEAALNKPQ